MKKRKRKIKALQINNDSGVYMGKLFFNIFILGALVLLSFFSLTISSYGVDEPNVYELFKDMALIKVYVEPVVDSTSDGKVDKDLIKKELQNAISARMTLNMQIVEDKASSDIAIKCDVVEYFWTDKDPVDMIAGIGAITMDALIKENYSRMSAIFTISNKEGSQIWSRKVKATITDRNMSKDDSSTMSIQRLVKIFMREAFSKKHSKKS